MTETGPKSTAGPNLASSFAKSIACLRKWRWRPRQNSRLSHWRRIAMPGNVQPIRKINRDLTPRQRPLQIRDALTSDQRIVQVHDLQRPQRLEMLNSVVADFRS